MQISPYQRLAKLLERQASKSTGDPADNSTTPSNTMDCLIILDRRIDMITPLMTQLTYEGLIDEKYNIKNCKRIGSFRVTCPQFFTCSSGGTPCCAVHGYRSR